MSLVSSAIIVAWVTPAAAQVHIDAQGRITGPSQESEKAPATEAVEAKPNAEATAPVQENRPAARPPEQTSQPATSQTRSIEQGGELHLACGGAGAANKIDFNTDSERISGTFNTFGSNGMTSGSFSGSTSGNEWETRVQGFADEVSLSMTSEEGRLRMPPVMLPPLRGGENGWFELSDIEIEPGEIRATINVNFHEPPTATAGSQDWIYQYLRARGQLRRPVRAV
ncbi:MAG: hypothetical protein ABIT10_10435 [Alteraurantiacibacter sp.]